MRRVEGNRVRKQTCKSAFAHCSDLETKAARDREAAEFFAAAPRDLKERRALQKATLTALARE